jgi:hypothetical protein
MEAERIRNEFLVPTDPVETVDSPTANSSERNWFNRYVEMEPDSSHAYWATIWQIASYVVIAAYIVLATIAALFTGFYDANYLPIAAVVAYSFIEPIYQLHLYLYGISLKEDTKAKTEESVSHYLNLLPDNDMDIFRILIQDPAFSIFRENSSNDFHFSELRNVIARYQHWLEISKNFSRQIDEINLRNPSDSPNEVHEKQLKVLDLREQMLIAKVFAAYMYAIVLNPHLEGDWHDIFNFYLPNINLRLRDQGLAREFEQEPDQRLVIFKDTLRNSLKNSDVHNMGIAELANALVSSN